MIIKFLKPFSFLPALFLMYMIYSFSAQDGDTSGQLSYQVSYRIVEVGGNLLGADLQDWEIDKLATRFNGPVRKLAHMTEYFALAVAVAFPLYVYGLRGILLLLAAGIICVGFACGDEYHQSMVAGRGPSKRDVLIDSFGVFWGIILVRIIGWTGRQTIFRPFARKKKEYAQQPDEYGNQPGEYTSYPGSYRNQPGGYTPYPDGRARQSRDYMPYSDGRVRQGGDYAPYPDGRARQPGGYAPYPDGRTQQPGGYAPYPDGRAWQNRGYAPYPDGRAQQTGSFTPYPDGRAQQSQYDLPPQEGYYPEPPYNYPAEDDYDQDEPVTSSDYLSEDMSLRKLVSDLKDQKQNRRESRKKNSSETHGGK